MIRVLIVDDSDLICQVLTAVLSSDTGISVIGIAHNGKEAVEMVVRLKPDIITMDIHMPIMDGYEATKQIMAYNPTPILIVAASVIKGGMDKVFKAISLGALDILDKGSLGVEADEQFKMQLIEKIKFLSKVRVLSHPLAKFEKAMNRGMNAAVDKRTLTKIVGIVASTGGPQAIIKILKGLPRDLPCGIVMVQHIAKGFTEGLVEWFDSGCELDVKVAEDGEEIRTGVVYIAPSDFQMKIKEYGKLGLFDEPSIGGHKPSGDALLKSIAEFYKEGSIGVLLSGMGKDGARGMKAIKENFGQTIAQDEGSSVIFGMPKAAIDIGAVDSILPLDKIPQEIIKMLER